MKKVFFTCISVMLLSIMMTLPVMADNYTGWSTEQDKVVYYVNGVKQHNVWILKGNTLHFIGADGLLDNTQAADISAAAALGITNYIVADQKVKYDVPLKQVAGDNFSAAKYAFNVANDYEAFLYLYPQYKTTLSPEACYDYYLSSYHNGDTANKYLQALDGYVYTWTNMPHKYAFSYVPNYDGTHKSYSPNGNFLIEECACYDHGINAKDYRCAYCGATYKYRTKKYHSAEDPRLN